MATGFLHGTSVFKIPLFPAVFLISIVLANLFPAGVRHAYAAPWFTTFKAGVLSGSTGTDSVKTTQPYFLPTDIFENSLVQPGVVNPTMVPPGNDTYDFLYGGIITRDGYDVKGTDSGGSTGPTVDAFAKNIGILGNSLPNYQRFVDAAETTSCAQRNKLLTACNLNPGIYKASLTDINNSLDDLTNGDKKYHIGTNNDGLLILVQEDPASVGTITIKYNLVPVSSAGYKRLVIVTNGKINIASTVGNTNVVTQSAYLSQEADIQAMLITTYNVDPSVEISTGSNRVKIDGLIVSKGKVRFRRDADTALVKWPGVFVQYNPFYITELAKLDESLNIFGPSSARWSYE